MTRWRRCRSVLAREKLCTMPRSKKNCCVDFDVIWVPRSDAAFGSRGAVLAEEPFLGERLVPCGVHRGRCLLGPEVATGDLGEQASSTGTQW